jgi:hypothetical protein
VLLLLFGTFGTFGEAVVRVQTAMVAIHLLAANRGDPWPQRILSVSDGATCVLTRFWNVPSDSSSASAPQQPLQAATSAKTPQSLILAFAVVRGRVGDVAQRLWARSLIHAVFLVSSVLSSSQCLHLVRQRR